MTVTWKPDGLGREVAYFGEIQIGAVMPVPHLTTRRPYDDWQWAVWLPPVIGAHWAGCISEETAKASVEKAASHWLSKAGLLYGVCWPTKADDRRDWQVMEAAE